MAQAKKFKTFKEFWPEYMRLHSRPITRGIHYAGTLGGFALAAAGITMASPALVIAAPLFTYGLLFPSHPIFEKNVPATLKNPFMSVGGDLKLLYCWMTGRIRDEYEKHGLDYTGKTGNNQNDPAVIRPSESTTRGPSLLSGIRNKLRRSFNKPKPEANDNNGPAPDSGPDTKPSGPTPSP
ncbi:MAG: DUF962 domain-containing protein [Proteobacteria bacterium]|nr:DUF962 domain-containing protein [Pseudomonadota bacterium]